MLEQFLSAFLVSLKINITIIPILFFIYQFSKFIFKIPIGFISDKFGREKSTLIGFSILITSYFLLLKEDINLFYISFFFKGLGLTFISGSVESMYIESINSDNLLKYNTIKRFVFYSRSISVDWRSFNKVFKLSRDYYRSFYNGFTSIFNLFFKRSWCENRLYWYFYCFSAYYLCIFWLVSSKIKKYYWK